jgi:ankyrin repeat protein
MPLFRKTQVELDAAFLKAVAEYKFSKAKRLLKRGANVLARDADDNTALHKMARNNPDSGDCHRELFGANYRIADEFVCFLLNQKLEINATNKYGKTCLHYAAANENDDEAKITGIFLNRGANPNIPDRVGMAPLHHAVSVRSATKLIENGARVNVQDRDGRTPLHVAAAKGEDSLVYLYLKADKSAVAIKDKNEKYPHESAAAGPAGHHMLSRFLLDQLNLHHYTVQVAKKQKELEQASAALLKDGWVLLDPEKVAHVDVQKSLGYKLTEIFNFHARTYTLIAQNLETESEMTVIKSFDDFPDPTILKDGYHELIRLGGKAEKSAIYKQVLNKNQPKLPRPGPD